MGPINEQSEHPEPVVEAARGGATPLDPTTRALHLRIRHLLGAAMHPVERPGA